MTTTHEKFLKEILSGAILDEVKEIHYTGGEHSEVIYSNEDASDAEQRDYIKKLVCRPTEPLYTLVRKYMAQLAGIDYEKEGKGSIRMKLGEDSYSLVFSIEEKGNRLVILVPTVPGDDLENLLELDLKEVLPKKITLEKSV